MAQVTIHVPPRPYQARIENGLLARSGNLLAELLPRPANYLSSQFRPYAGAGAPSWFALSPLLDSSRKWS